MKRTIMVTEPTGMLEQEIIKKLRDRDFCVKIAVHHNLEAKVLSYECPVVTLDYTDPQSCRNALEGVRGVFLGLPVSYPGLDEVFLPFVRMAREMAVEQIVGLGSIGQGTDSPLMVVEKCIINCGIDYTLLRPNLFMQHFKNIAAGTIRKDRSIQLPAGDAKISFVDVRDVAEAAVKSFQHSKHHNKMYTITGNDSLDHYQIAEILTRVTGKKITYTPVSHNELWRILRENGWDNDSIELMVGLYEIARHGWSENVSGDLEAVLEKPPITFEQFAKDYLKEWSAES